MARRPRDARIETREARQRLKPRKEPYWRQIHTGLAVGYYRGVRGGAWYVRRMEDGTRRTQRIAVADDFADGDGANVLSYGDAVKLAMTGKTAKPATPEGMYSVTDAVDHYLADLKARSPRNYRDAEIRFETHVLPALGGKLVASLTRAGIRRWHQQLAKTASDDAEKQRQRRATSNRNLSTLKAALNFAYHEGRVSDRSAWDQVKPFRNADSPRIRHLSRTEARRLVNASDPEFRPLVRGALLTGCRYGELASLQAGDFDGDAAVLFVNETKTGRVRHVPLTDEGVEFFTEQVVGKLAGELVFARDTGREWRKSEQCRPIRAACKIARIDPPVSFHVLRHTYGSLLARKGVPLQIISAAMGHADTRMTERHYAHLSPDHVAQAVRKNLPRFVRGSGKVARL